jgi:hypothetical protein
MSASPSPSSQPKRSPRNTAARIAATSGCKVLNAATSAAEERRTAQVLAA